jgi:hypothetical protein
MDAWTLDTTIAHQGPLDATQCGIAGVATQARSRDLTCGAEPERVRTPLACRLADPCTDRLARLTGEPHNAVNTTAFDRPLHPAQPRMPWHTLDRASDPHGWSVRVSRDVRVIVHKTDACL